MRALVWRGPYDHSPATLEAPEPGPGEVLVEVALVGVCGSDVTAHKGVMGISKPGAVRGHEFAGTVRAAPAGSFEPGTRVTVNPVLSCGVCRACRRGRPSSCEAIQIIGVHRPGAFAQFVLAPADHVHPVPASMSWQAAASCEPLAQARHDVALAAEIAPLGECLVVGSGSIGLWVVHALRAEWAASVTVVDPDAGRRQSALGAGADAVLGSIDEAPVASFDTVFDVVGIPATRGAAVARARNGGVVIAVGLAADEVAIPWFDLVRREVTVRGANTFAPDDFAVALEWLASDRVALPDAVREVPLAEGGETFAAIVEGRDPFAGKTFFVP